MVTPSPIDWLSVGRSACPSLRPSVTHSIETRRGEWPVTSSSCACPKDFQSNLSNITTFNQTQKALQLIFLSSMKMMKQPCRTRMWQQTNWQWTQRHRVNVRQGQRAAPASASALRKDKSFAMASFDISYFSIYFRNLFEHIRCLRYLKQFLENYP